jgi:hypothetical protein
MPRPMRSRLAAVLVAVLAGAFAAVPAQARPPGDPAGSAAAGQAGHDHAGHDHAGHDHAGQAGHAPAGHDLGAAGATSSVVPPDQRDTGLVYAGLVPDETGPCRGMFRLEGTDDLCSHGPDAAPPGVDLRRTPDPLPTAAPVLPPVLCGSGAIQVQVVYAVASDRLDRYDTFVDSIRQWSVKADDIYRKSAAHTGGTRNILFLHNAACEIVVSHAVITPAGDDSLGATITDLKSLGYNNPGRKYMIFADANVYCGIGTIKNDASAGPGNLNNKGPSYGRTDAGCWANTVAPAHELMHNLGGVQNNAPHTSNGYHCTDEYDAMCYNDGGGDVLTHECPSELAASMDCNHEDYFSTSPRSGTYLDTNWNAANSDWLFQGPQGAWAYVWANQPAAASYTPSLTYQYNSVGGNNTITRSGIGLYTVDMPGVGANTGTVAVTAYGSGSDYCKVGAWWSAGADLSVTVRCFTSAGVATDSAFAAHYVRAVPSMGPMGYVWANDPTDNAYLPSAQYQFNSTGVDNDMIRLGLGSYRVRMPGLTDPGGHVTVTAYGAGSEVCRPELWFVLLGALWVDVQCFTAAGAAADTRFTATYVNDATVAGLTGWPAGYVLADQPATDEYEPPAATQFNSSGETNTVERTGAGAYRVVLPGVGSSGGHVQVTAYDTGSNECKVLSWGPSGDDQVVYVRCYTTAGAAADTKFTASFYSMLWS